MIRQITIDAILRLINALLLKGYPNIIEVAQILSISQRSLQRLLNEEGVSYSGLVDRCRYQIACESLEHTRDSMPANPWNILEIACRKLPPNLGTKMPAASPALSGAGAAQRRVTIASILAVRGVSVSRHERLDVKNAGTWHEMAIRAVICGLLLFTSYLNCYLRFIRRH